jgi:predicted amidophosphoribosyltransferase
MSREPPTRIDAASTPLMEPSIRSLVFASCYVYSPCGVCAVSARSRSFCAMLKSDEAGLISVCARRVLQQVHGTPTLRGFFEASDVLIPIPANQPDRPRDALSCRLADALVAQGLAGRAWSGLRRIRAVPNSSTAAPGRRPSVLTHYQSLEVATGEPKPGQPSFLLVDDVVAKGRTLFAAALRLHEAFPGARIRAFALVRTLGFAQDLERLLEPCVGRIGWRAGDVHRNP